MKNTCFHSLVITLFVLLTNQILHAQHPELDSLRNKLSSNAPFGKEKFGLTMELAKKYRQLRPLRKDTIHGFSEDYLNYGKKALDWAEKNGSPEQLSMAELFQIDYALYYNYYVDNTNFDAFLLSQKLINKNVFASLEDKYSVYVILSDLYFEKGFYKRVFELLPLRYQMGRALNKPYTEAYREFGFIAKGYYELKDYNAARKYYRLALDSIKEEKFPIRKASFNNNIALSFAKEGRDDSAAYYYRQSLKIIELAPSEAYNNQTPNYAEHIKNVIKSNIAYLDVKNGNYDPAIKAVKRELASGKTENEITTVIQAYNKLGQLYYYKKQYIIAVQYLDSAMVMIRSGIDDSAKLRNLNQKAKVFLAIGKQEEAEKMFKYAQNFEDSISEIKSTAQAKVASVLYETEKKEKELQQQQFLLSEKNNEISRKEQLQTIYALALSALSLLLIISVYFFRKMKSQKVKIERQKIAVDNSLREKEILFKEIHHRVKNNLQVVSSLLNKQGENSEDLNVKKLMEDGQNRIKSMAMIHQQLYQTSDFENIDLKKYTQLLTASIAESNKVKGMEITTEIIMPEINSHIDIAVPYGLILNEIISNCYEYAFIGLKSGKITITVTPMDDKMYKLTVSDNGRGLPQDMEERSKKSLGINLIKGLAWQLRGELTYFNNTQGSTFEVTFINNLKNVA